MSFAHIDGDHLTMLNVYHAFKQSKYEMLYFLKNIKVITSLFFKTMKIQLGVMIISSIIDR